MLAYWLLFLLPAAACLMAPGKPAKPDVVAWWGTGLGLTLMVGLRHQVGGDWGNYEQIFRGMENTPWEDVLTVIDPGYALLNKLCSSLQWNIYAVNLVCAALSCGGLMAFCHMQPRPWLALVAAIPYLVIVVFMGYTRQAVALGMAMLGLVGLARHQNIWFVLCVAMGATFHKTALVMIPLAILATPHNRIWTAVWVGITTVSMYFLLLADSVGTLVTNYVEAEYQSQGALVRVAMNFAPAMIFLFLGKHLKLPPSEQNLWRILGLMALISLALMFSTAATTAVDRMALYILPLQMFVASRLPELMQARHDEAGDWVLCILLYYAAVQYVWLNHAVHAEFWLPYDLRLPMEHLWSASPQGIVNLINPQTP